MILRHYKLKAKVTTCWFSQLWSNKLPSGLRYLDGTLGQDAKVKASAVKETIVLSGIVCYCGSGKQQHSLI